HVLTNHPAEGATELFARYREVWQRKQGSAPMPKLGMTRHVVVAATDAEAEAIARTNYATWFANLTKLWRDFGSSPIRFARDFDEARQRGYAVSGLAQPVAGFFVDHFGARRVLLSGMVLAAVAIASAGLAPSYWALLPLAGLAGLGNSVFHPADYSMLNAAVGGRRIARAYSVHQISGNLGWVLAPVLVGTVTHLANWRIALLTAGGAALLATLVIALQTRGLGAPMPPLPRAHGTGLRADLRMLMAVPILMAFGYFVLLTASTGGIQTFAVPALGAIYQAPLVLATGALTVYLCGNASGVLTGGFLADRATRHDIVAAAGVLCAATLMVMLASGALPLGAISVVMAMPGFSMVVTAPSRDMLVRAATPRGSSGKVFG